MTALIKQLRQFDTAQEKFAHANSKLIKDFKNNLQQLADLYATAFRAVNQTAASGEMNLPTPGTFRGIRPNE